MFKKLIKWSLKEHSSLPWRKKRNLYGTLVSEIMLQQTTVSTVINHFDKFLEEYPTIENLAKTTEDEICISWKGLGYYRRARNLRKAAISIVEDYNGVFPKKKDELLTIPGIGEYTASALLSIGSNKKHLAVDANLERVLSRIYAIEVEKGPKLHKKIQELFTNKEIIEDRSKYSFRELNEALMDLGRIYCKATNVQCDICPMNKKCMGRKLEPLNYPIQTKKKKTEIIELNLLKIIVKRGDKVLAIAREDDQWLSGQIEIPTFIIDSDDKVLKQYPQLKDKIKIDNTALIKTSITKYRIKNYILEMKVKEFKQLKSSQEVKFTYFPIENTNFTTTSIKCLKKTNLYL